ncbi:beta-galactosidase [Alteriqipengyuania sp. WL0013]|uniref:beta-galactosidase n=1 Tax=Alteriqipengyuania sp. WL0013 TaxID=3110773 RepID=UPI002CF1DC98|nr:beta-galactosidase [Alteriqipengyuania sp. WL0013]MEB3414440.1 beta-galactosidase [Alteriqipengyuania sp. WL0013]
MHLGTCYFPEHWPRERWAQDAAMMAEIGIDRVRLGEFAWSRIEPEPGSFDWEWLDEAIEVLAAAGHKLILCTPTATPPKWLVDRMPDMVALDREGRPRGFGSRRHYCFSHDGYAAEAARIARVVAERYGRHDAVVGWQTDNEYGCHDTVQSFSAAAREGFRRWLAGRYDSIGALNEAWGNVFWSMEYRDFAEIELPNLTVTEANPAHWLAFRRYSSDRVIDFNRTQSQILRECSPGRDIMHNAMGFYTGYDHHDLGRDLDVMGWDSYPLGFLEMFRFSDTEKRQFARSGHPDIAAFHHDLYRGTTNGGRWNVLEQQPGPVNWARHNPAPAPGMVRLWTLEAMAHGAEMVSYFRWRQFPKAQEQMHAGILRTDASPAPAHGEVAQSAQDIAAIGTLGEAPKHAALVFAYDAEWVTQIQPQGEGCSALWAAFRSYEALRRLGLNVDIVSPAADVALYPLVVIPCLPILPDGFAQRLAQLDGQLVIGPRTGTRDPDFAIPDAQPLADLLGGEILLSETLGRGIAHEGDGWAVTRWLDHFEGEADAELVAEDGTVACWRHGNTRLCTGWPEGALISEILTRAALDAGLPTVPMPAHRRRRDCGHTVFTFDYSDGSVTWEKR